MTKKEPQRCSIQFFQYQKSIIFALFSKVLFINRNFAQYLNKTSKKRHYSMRKFIIILLSLVLFGIHNTEVIAQNFHYTKRFYFKLGKYDIDEDLKNNNSTIDSILITIRELKRANASDIRLHVTSYASLESSDTYNTKLTTNRTYALMDYLRKYTIADDVQFIAEENTFDWQRLIELTETSDCPNKAKAVDIMRNIPTKTSIEGNLRIDMLKELGGGKTYEYMRKHFFSELRSSTLTLTAKIEKDIKTYEDEAQAKPFYPDINTDEAFDTWIFPRRGLVALRTNLLYDIAAVPNLGVDVYATDHISFGLNGMFAWWHNSKANKYWRIYGGDIHTDYWFDNSTFWRGHHIGLFAETFTFDIEWGKKGHQSSDFAWGCGLSYGYATKLSKHLCLDFSIGVGYLTGKYYTYEPSQHHHNIYYTTFQKKREFIGPTKAEVSLIWKLGKEQ